jgi:NADP-dependent 3-hydroxy acid dehydrogenase YdfG
MPFEKRESDGIVTPPTADGHGIRNVAIITGCASGVGLSTTNLFLSHQYIVFGIDMHPMDYTKLEDEVQERFYFHQGNLTNESQCDEIVRLCVEKYG